VAWQTVRERVGRDELECESGRAFAIAWQVCVNLGAPVAHVCEVFGEAFSEFGRIERDVETAVAGPKFASRIMLTLPAVGVLLAAALGLNAIEFLLSTALGWICLSGGVGLLGLALWWSRQLIAGVHLRDAPLGVVPLVTSAALRAGIGMRTASDALDSACDKAGLLRFAPVGDRELQLASAWGIPLADVVLVSARLDRAREMARVRSRAQELSERLLVPLGACVLPAFILLSVVPIVVQLIGSTGLKWGGAT
jgi:tight adherence protein B